MNATIYTYDRTTLEVIDTTEVELNSCTNDELEILLTDVNQVIEF